MCNAKLRITTSMHKLIHTYYFEMRERKTCIIFSLSELLSLSNQQELIYFIRYILLIQC